MSDTATKIGPPPASEGNGEETGPNLSQGMTLSLETLQHFVDEIAKMDEILDAATGVKGEVAIRNRMAEDFEYPNDEKKKAAAEKREPVSTMDRLVDDLVASYFSNFDGEQLVGAIYGFHRNLTDRYSAEIKATVDAVLEAQKVSGEKPDEEKVTWASKRRSDLLKVFRASRETLRAFGFNVDSIEEPEGRRGSVGKRAVQAWLRFQYSVDGVPMTGKENSLKGVAEKVGAEKVSELKDAYLATGNAPTKTVKGKTEVDLKRLPPEFSFTYNGKNITAVVLDKFKNPDGTVASDDVSDEEDDSAEADDTESVDFTAEIPDEDTTA